MQGSRRAIRRHMVRCLTDACAELGARGLSIAKKSVIIRSDMDDARYIAGAMQRRGYPIQCKSQASYLGTDL
eukprot:6450024-Pyramimonas_sp.AAC.1